MRVRRVGPLRFAPPQPLDGWTGVRDATTFGPPAMQGASAVSAGLSVSCPAERGLPHAQHLDARRRRCAPSGHGVAPRRCLHVGSGSMPMFHGATLARRGDVVVVTINYRLGLFGYLRGSTCAERRCRRPATRGCSTRSRPSSGSGTRSRFRGRPRERDGLRPIGRAGSIAAMLAMAPTPGNASFPEGDPSERVSPAVADARRRQPA